MSSINDVLDELLASTNQGKLQWAPSARSDEFVASIGEISVSLREVRGSMIFGARYRLEIVSSEGWTVESLETPIPITGVSEGQPATEEQTRKLQMLFQAAKRTTMDVQSTLDKLVDDLRNR